MIYVRNNAAKQWILEELDHRFMDGAVRILDLGCGDAGEWAAFLPTHPETRVVGIDTDARVIARGRASFHAEPRIDLRVFDAQERLTETFDVVVAMSAIEHVVDRPAFLRTTWSALRSGGTAYLNYDVGHFRSRDVKERIMVPVSQMLAMVGIEGPYMKRVHDAAFRKQAETVGFRVLTTKKHNLAAMKKIMKGAEEPAILEWFAFERKLNDLFPPERLDPVMLSTTLVVQKP
ncbi:class I SAM-dependent methyltransferase [Candidatus Uhrbacteria bacterium]|nr:class I SAM-dependent methyltransferase [Candidatus Uhrbacteria bacterium]